ncbi:MAG TPA: alanine racemase [Candidatus Baltobacteraceae bacterium]
MIGHIRVSLDALAHNARAMRDLVAPAKAAFVVKGNAYGHGIVPVAKTVEPYAHRLCVYSLSEAVALRDAGITLPVFVMGPVESADADEARARKLEIALWDTGSYLRAIAGSARKRNEQVPVHVKINTGTNRLGLEPHDAPDAIEDYARLPEIAIAGLFSHLAAAEELDSPFTLAQLATFERTVQAVDQTLQNKGIRPARHIAASAAAMLWPQTRLDMVRIGIALYGLWPSPQTRVAMSGAHFDLQPALSLHSSLAAIRSVEAGAPIGYGNSYHAPKRTRIGVVPLGYADGIPRLLSNRGAFLVHGERCPIVGRVCMNMTMIDLAAAPQARPGDEVVLLGRHGAGEVSADDWGEWAQTISYEIVTRLPAELPRVYEPLSQ